MIKINLKLYLVFILAFLVMHFTGLLVKDLPYISNAVIVFALVLSTVLLISRVFYASDVESTISEIGFRKACLQEILPGIIISVVLLFMYPLLGYLLGTKIRMTNNWQLNMIGLLLTGGLAEEILFRGFLFRRLRLQMNFKKATLVSAIVFAMAHLLLFMYLNWTVALLSTVLAAGLSLPFAYLFERGGNALWSPALVHATIRTVGLVFTTDQQNFMALSSAWIIMSLVIPYIVLLFYKDFRSVMKGSKI